MVSAWGCTKRLKYLDDKVTKKKLNEKRLLKNSYIRERPTKEKSNECLLYTQVKYFVTKLIQRKISFQ